MGDEPKPSPPVDSKPAEPVPEQKPAEPAKAEEKKPEKEPSLLDGLKEEQEKKKAVAKPKYKQQPHAKPDVPAKAETKAPKPNQKKVPPVKGKDAKPAKPAKKFVQTDMDGAKLQVAPGTVQEHCEKPDPKWHYIASHYKVVVSEKALEKVRNNKKWTQPQKQRWLKRQMRIVDKETDPNGAQWDIDFKALYKHLLQ